MSSRMEVPVDPLPAFDQSDERWQLALRISAGTQLRNSPRLRELLLFLVQETISERGADLHEQLIGCRVFGRQPGYNSSDDNIVRVQARQLRLKLDAWYADEGQAESLLLAIPKGSYVPLFTPRPQPAAPAVEAAPGLWTGRRLLLAAGAILAVIATALALSRISGNRAAPPSARLSSTSIWSHMVDADHPTHVVVADSCLALVQNISRKRLSLKNYIDGDYSPVYEGLSPEMKSTLEYIATRQYTSIADSALAARMIRLSGETGPRVSIKYARDLQMRDLKTAHVVLLGSRKSNPWVELFEPQLNFIVDHDEASNTPFVRNRAPHAGEQAEYRGSSQGGQEVGYGVVAFLPNLNRDGNILIIAGTTMNATEAAGDRALNPPRTSPFYLKMQERRRSGNVPYFELLMRTSSMSGVARGAELVAYRILGPAT